MRAIAKAILILAIALLTIWMALALWYRLPVPQLARGLAGWTVALIGAVTIIALFGRFRRIALSIFLVMFGVAVVWWSTIVPPRDADWAPDVARQVTGTFNGEILTLTNVRDFEWRSNDDFTERWTVRSYDLTKLQSLDIFMSYWGGPEIAHVILSFGFENDTYLAWSVEVKRRVGGEFSPVADFFKSNPLVIIAADERDVVGVRSNVRGEDVQLYRLKASPDVARMLLREYVTDANALALKPKFYNSITTNCTTTVLQMARAVGDVVPFDWRLLVNGYLPDYIYERGSLDSRMPLSELKSRAHIKTKAQAAGFSPDFSHSIRSGVPSPHLQQ